jgi:hypothetical protein
LGRRLAFFTREIGIALAFSREHLPHARHKTDVPSRVLHLQLCLVVTDGLAVVHNEVFWGSLNLSYQFYYWSYK